MDRMRESVFAILGDLTGKSWLDMFSGSGTIAIEAVSRGATEVQLCEKDKIKVKTIFENVSVTEKELGVKIDYLSGTSSGSMFATFYAMGYNTDEIKEKTT